MKSKKKNNEKETTHGDCGCEAEFATALFHSCRWRMPHLRHSRLLPTPTCHEGTTTPAQWAAPLTTSEWWAEQKLRLPDWYWRRPRFDGTPWQWAPLRTTTLAARASVRPWWPNTIHGTPGTNPPTSLATASISDINVVKGFWTRSYLLGFRVIRIPEKSSVQFGRKEEDRCTLHITYFFLPDLVRVRIDSSPGLVRVRSLTSSAHSCEGRALQTKFACMLLPLPVLTVAAASTPPSRNRKHESSSDLFRIDTARENTNPWSQILMHTPFLLIWGMHTMWNPVRRHRRRGQEDQQQFPVSMHSLNK
jgi:hypothetical protein